MRQACMPDAELAEGIHIHRQLLKGKPGTVRQPGACLHSTACARVDFLRLSERIVLKD